jgi:hypothetical protein
LGLVHVGHGSGVAGVCKVGGMDVGIEEVIGQLRLEATLKIVGFDEA